MHTINFMQNVIKIYQKLLFLLLDLDIILLKLALGSNNNNYDINQQLQQIFYIVSEKIQIEFNYLHKNHLDYQNIIINNINLSVLSKNIAIYYSLFI